MTEDQMTRPDSDPRFYVIRQETPVSFGGSWSHNDVKDVFESADPEEIRGYFQEINGRQIHNYHLEIYSGDIKDPKSQQYLEFIAGEDFRRDPDLI